MGRFGGEGSYGVGHGLGLALDFGQRPSHMENPRIACIMHVCRYVIMYVCMFVHTVRTYLCMCVCMHVCIYRPLRSPIFFQCIQACETIAV